LHQIIGIVQFLLIPDQVAMITLQQKVNVVSSPLVLWLTCQAKGSKKKKKWFIY